MKQFILTSLIFLLGISCFISIRSCINEQAAKSRLEQTLRNTPKAPLTPIKIVKDTVFKVDRQKYEPTIIAEDDDLSLGVSPTYVDSISRALKVSQDKVTSLTKANLTLEAKLRLFQHRDSLTGRLWAGFKDQAFDIRYYPDSSDLYLRANVGLNFLDHKDRKNFLKQWSYYTETWTTDKRFTINGLNRVIREGPKKSRIGIDAYVGPVFTPQGLTYVSFGVGVGYRLIEF